METIIALVGKAKTGKSPTFEILYNILQNRIGYIEDKKCFKKNQGGRDYRAVFEKNGKRIGIASSGDKSEILDRQIKILNEFCCNICVCTCHPFIQGKSNMFSIIFKSNNSKNHFFINKTLETANAKQMGINNDDALKIITLIEMSLNI
jgi:hypothetical protein